VPPRIEEVRESIRRKVEAIKRHSDREKLAAGWTKTEDGDWIPPGWVRAEGAPGGDGAAEDDTTPRDSM